VPLNPCSWVAPCCRNLKLHELNYLWFHQVFRIQFTFIIKALMQVSFLFNYWWNLHWNWNYLDFGDKLIDQIFELNFNMVGPNWNTCDYIAYFLHWFQSCHYTFNPSDHSFKYHYLQINHRPKISLYSSHLFFFVTQPFSSFVVIIFQLQYFFF